MVLFQLVVYQCTQAEAEDLVEIADPNFLNALLNAGVDSNGDGQISESEAAAVTSIRLPSSGIRTISGIAAFLNLDTLVADVNPIESPDLSENLTLRSLSLAGCGLETLDISKNTNLKYLDCSGNIGLDNFLVSLDLSGNPLLETLLCEGNELSALDISQNPMLQKLACSRNRIEELELSANGALTELSCKNNWLSSLDLSHNTALVTMVCCGNRLSSLDISGNTALKLIGVDNMSTMEEVCVWTLPFPPEGVKVLMGFSPNVFFTTQCTNP